MHPPCRIRTAPDAPCACGLRAPTVTGVIEGTLSQLTVGGQTNEAPVLFSYDAVRCRARSVAVRVRASLSQPLITGVAFVAGRASVLGGDVINITGECSVLQACVLHVHAFVSLAYVSGWRSCDRPAMCRPKLRHRERARSRLRPVPGQPAHSAQRSAARRVAGTHARRAPRHGGGRSVRVLLQVVLPEGVGKDLVVFVEVGAAARWQSTTEGRHVRGAAEKRPSK